MSQCGQAAYLVYQYNDNLQFKTVKVISSDQNIINHIRLWTK
ncbi:hypothetical protein P344_06435 [Spiroplasma mirum ATCC 29335]|uniref:Uncharacterized protein n=1 Tax=Spiroplasma mirum ATCC 29335 TaxID=838561 RepID=W6APE4_9MOLU|nr:MULTISPECIES: hypothetical protein [Spiroplasma]AHI58590.1 hypothetical protein P344_06435 [Spiroplasma mirum ATCC 29335]